MPDGLSGQELVDAVQKRLEDDLPEVLEDADFMHPTEGSIEIEGETVEFELGKNA